jgi:hypothetical protein
MTSSPSPGRNEQRRGEESVSLHGTHHGDWVRGLAGSRKTLSRTFHPKEVIGS